MIQTLTPEPRLSAIFHYLDSHLFIVRRPGFILSVCLSRVNTKDYFGNRCFLLLLLLLFFFVCFFFFFFWGVI